MTVPYTMTFIPMGYTLQFLAATTMDVVVPTVTTGGGGDMNRATYDPTTVNGDAFARANMTGTQTASTISDFDTEVANNTAVASNTTHRGLSNNPHTVTALQAGAIVIDSTGAIGNLGATPSNTLVDGYDYTATYSAEVTSWAGLTLANGATASIGPIDNSGAYAVATTGLVAIESGALDDIASDGVELILKGEASRIVARALLPA